MAGEIPLPATEAPDFNPGCVTARFDTATDAVSTAWFYCEKDTVIDAVTARWATAGGASFALNLESLADGTASDAGTVITSTAIDLTGTVDTNTAAVVDPDNNLVPAGNWVGIKFTGTPTGIVDLAVWCRFRQRIR